VFRLFYILRNTQHVYHLAKTFLGDYSYESDAGADSITLAGKFQALFALTEFGHNFIIPGPGAAAI
jgi:hypothetical protein